MGIKFTQLQCKEVICVSDGRRLGFIEDVEVEVPEGRVCAIIVPGPCRFPGLRAPRDVFCIPWHSICKSVRTLFWWISGRKIAAFPATARDFIRKHPVDSSSCPLFTIKSRNFIEFFWK